MLRLRPGLHANTALQRVCDFQQLVLQKSIDKPVLVDFWADWCEPCKTIMPMLAKLADEYAGKFELAKVNADAERELAGHFGIKSLPTMKLFYQGKIVTGLIYLCTVGLFGIGIIYDFWTLNEQISARNHELAA